MWLSSRAFRQGLYLEHLQEAALLYTQCRALRGDEEVPYTRLADFEARLAAHVDALAIGGEPAWQYCQRVFDPDETGHWYALAMLACATRHAAGLAWLTQHWRADPAFAESEGEQRAIAIGDALRHALPRAWREALVTTLDAQDDPLRSTLAEAAAFHGLECSAALARALDDASAPCISLLRALGRAQVTAAVPRLVTLAESDAAPEVRREALLALARLGDPAAPRLAAGLWAEAEVAHLVVGLVGGRDAVRGMLGRLEAGSAHVHTVLALGLLGDLAAVRPLVVCLSDEALAGAAAEALEWITGAGLRDASFISETPDPSTWFDEEILRFERTGLPPDRPDGKPYGRWCNRPSRDAVEWRSWLAANVGRFTRGLRYRHGAPASPSGAVASLLNESRTATYRQLAVEELAIRHRAQSRLDIHMPVGRQMHELHVLGEWARQADKAVPQGVWLFACQPI